MKKSTTLLLLALLVLTAFPLFDHLDSPPVWIWDESRVGTSAIEMAHNHNLLIVTYDGKPDMWSTKPPFMIWMQAISLRIFGMNEFATRFPSALAALATCLLLFFFIYRRSRNVLLATIVPLVLVTTLGYYKEHLFRTGDYDSLLTFFMLAYSMSYFTYLEDDKKRYLLATFGFLILAGLTKGIQSVIFLPGLFLYTVYKKKLVHIARQKETYFGIAAFLLIVVGYYFLRDHYNPGYIKAVLQNEIGGRYNTVIEGHAGDGSFYFDDLINERFSYWYVFVLPGIAFGLLSKDRFIKNFMTLAVIVSVSYLLIISYGATKIYWYNLPLFPFIVFLVGISLYEICLILKNINLKDHSIDPKYLALIFLLGIFIGPYKSVVGFVSERVVDKCDPKDRLDMKIYLKDLMHTDHALQHCSLLDKYPSQDIYYYLTVLKYQGRGIPIVNEEQVDPNGKLLVFDAELKNKVENSYRSTVLNTYGSVTLYQLNGRK